MTAGVNANAGMSSPAQPMAGVPAAAGMMPAGTAGMTMKPAAGSGSGGSSSQAGSPGGASGTSSAAGASGEPGLPAAGSGQGGGGGSDGMCSDSCPASKAGVRIGCRQRFMFGVNYAWINFGMDFGGADKGVAANQANVLRDLKDMKDNGVSVVRWWMHPSFWGTGVTFDSSGTATGIAGTEQADIEAALALAEQAGVYLKLTLFSFDNFRGDDKAGHGITPIVNDAKKVSTLVEQVVRPIARAVASSPHADRMISWDVINEPEWAITGNDGRGDEAFDPNPELMSVPFAAMESFVSSVVMGIRKESKAPITVGQAAIKWAHAFSQVGLDYYDVHYYGWVDQYYPLGSKSLADYGLGDKPVVVGEYPLDGWTNPNGTLNANQIASKLFDLGYAGAKAWAFTGDGNWSGNKGQLQMFAKDKGCSVSY